MTPTKDWCFSILQFYWDGEHNPSVEISISDFFWNGKGRTSPLNSIHITGIPAKLLIPCPLKALTG
ncbi:DUF2961 domain-containing protein [Flagellimonas sp.]|uniref:DUF2961 domain-containing protein n=1 Tax=Flagellimonas sp. TaxID=2058762 RepID=UPI003BAEBF8A